MQISHIVKTNRRPGLAIFLIGLIFGVTAFYFFGRNNDNSAIKTENPINYNPETTNTISYGVSGIVEPGEALTIYAKRAGFVRQINVKEGDVVELGASMFLTVDPTVEAKLGIQEVAGALNILKAKSGLIEISQQKKLAEIGYGESVALSAITNAGSKENAEASISQLVAVLSQIETVVPQALLFVENNKSLFTAESMSLYNEVVKSFYGTEPNFLRSGITSGGTGEDLFSLINKTKNASSTELVFVSKKINDELSKILNLYQASESEFFDEDELANDSIELATYLELRSDLADLFSGLVSATNGASSYIDASSIAAIKNGNGTTSALLGLDTANALAEMTSLIEGKTNELSSAEMRALAIELGLGLTEAPFSGTVMEVYIEAGQYVNAGEPLVRLSGNGLKEVKVKLTGAGAGVLVGDTFMIDKKSVGEVDRVVPVLEAGSMTAYITITDSSVLVGEVVRGEIAVSVGAGLKVINRDYMKFDQSGPYVTTKAGEKIYFKIIHDNGESLVVESEREINEELIPAYGVRL